MRKAGTITNIVLLVAALFLVTACDNGGGNSGGNVSFRLSFAVSVDGAVKTGSSIIDVLFYGGGGGTASGNPYQYYTTTEGVAPVIDLGSYGWLVAAMQYDGEEYYRRKRQYGLGCAVPRMAPTLLDAFGLKVSDLTKRSRDKRVLAEIITPPSSGFRQARPTSTRSSSARRNSPA